jgi:uncharacterized protein YraI
MNNLHNIDNGSLTELQKATLWIASRYQAKVKLHAGNVYWFDSYYEGDDVFGVGKGWYMWNPSNAEHDLKQWRENYWPEPLWSSLVDRDEIKRRWHYEKST